MILIANRSAMKFLWPQMLWLLLTVPALVAAYVALLRRRKKRALRYASLGVVKEAIGPGQRFRRHVPPLLFLLSVIALIIAIAGPNAVITLPSQQQTIVLAMDVSLSMGARDVDPNRITAAQAYEWGLVEEVADPGKAFDAAMALAAKVAAQPPLSVAMTKLTVNRLTHALDDLTSHMDVDQFALSSLTEDHKEGVAAFLERRKPRFRGR